MGEQFIGHPCNLLDVWQIPTCYPSPRSADENNNGYTSFYNQDSSSPIKEGGAKFCRGVRKNLSGRWKRITTTKKPPHGAASKDVYTIPEHLRYQLKSLYVY